MSCKAYRYIIIVVDGRVYKLPTPVTPSILLSFAIQDYLSTQLQLIVESSTPKVLRSRDKEGGSLWTWLFFCRLIVPVLKVEEARGTRKDCSLL